MSIGGNTALTRPTKLNPIACDCCDKPTVYINSQRSEISRPCGMLPYVLCHECCNLPENERSQQVRKFVVRRAARFGIQWEEAVKAQLGWPA
jgi:hypothetical protein